MANTHTTTESHPDAADGVRVDAEIPGGGSDAVAERAERGDAARFDLRSLIGRYAVVLALLVMVAGFSLLRPDTFFTTGNFQTILITQSVLIVLALGLTIALAAGEFDLSIASMIGFSGGLIAYLSSEAGWSVGLAILVSFLAALTVGVFNGIFVVKFHVNSFIATLGMGTLILGLALAITGSTVIGNIPAALTDPARTELFGLDLPVYYALLLAALLWYFLEHTPLGRYVFFTGEGPEAARLAGVRVDRIRFGALVASSLFAWLAGVLLVGQTGAADPTFGAPFLLPAFAAGFLGATTIKPGRFNAWGTVIAVLLLATGTTGLQLLGAADWVENVFNGAALILAVTLAQLVSREE
jgi:ribose transport system permease protein